MKHNNRASLLGTGASRVNVASNTSTKRMQGNPSSPSLSSSSSAFTIATTPTSNSSSPISFSSSQALPADGSIARAPFQRQNSQFIVEVNAPYDGSSDVELSIVVGEKIIVEKMEGEWWYGRKADNKVTEGWFPSEYVNP